MALSYQTSNTERVDTSLFDGSHYLGKPAAATDRIVARRIELVRSIEDFCGRDYNLVDVGCGNGASMLLLASAMKHCLGLETYRQHQSEFERLKSAAGVENCIFSVVNIEHDDVTALRGQFDRLICFEVIEHLENDANTRIIADLLRSGGKAAISVPNKWWIFETHGARLPRFLGLPWNRVPLFSWLPRALHERYANARIYTASRIRHLLEQSGLHVTDIRYITAPLDVLPEGALKRLLCNTVFRSSTTSLPFLATSLFVVAQKP
jgi:2-polyprenyl-3-methyl-5-hydroxy-6-metoxy-1,4-benzoquinol methylase